MPSTYSTSLRLEMIATGEQTGSWSTTNNRNIGTLLEQAIAGTSVVTMGDANYTLTAANGLTDEARSAVLRITSSVALTAQRQVIIPGAPKLYLVTNATTGGQNLAVKMATGQSALILPGFTALVHCDGTNCRRAGVFYSDTADSINASAAVLSTLNVTGLSTLGSVAMTAATIGGNAVWHAGNFNPANYQGSLGYAPVQQGTGIGQLPNTVKLGWDGTALRLTVDATDLGGLATTAALNAGLNNYIPKAGGTFTGGVTVDSGGLLVSNGDIQARRGTTGTGAVYLGDINHYLYWDSANYTLGGSGTVWTTGNLPAPMSSLGGNFSGDTGVLGTFAVKGVTTLATTNVNLNLTVAGSTNLQAVNGQAAGFTTLNLSGNAALQSYSAVNASLSGVMTSLSPRGVGSGRAMVNSDNSFGPFSWSGSFVAFDVNGASFGINVFVSDERRKMAIAPASERALPLLRDVRFIDYDPIPVTADGAVDPRYMQPRQKGGVSAQQLRTVKAGWVDEMPDDERTLMPNVLLLLTNTMQAVQELDQEVQELRAALAAMRGE